MAKMFFGFFMPAGGAFMLTALSGETRTSEGMKSGENQALIAIGR
jgi:hypothetical protein